MPKATDYEKLTPREHVLARPDMYIGSIEIINEIMDVYDKNENKIISKTIKYNPGLFKCFDELLVNARDATINDKTCDTIKVEINTEEKYIKFYNNGNKCIPVEEHPKFKTLVPSMIFGELLTSSNYDDTQKRTTGGKNGIGGKAANIYSIRFEVEIGDCNNGKKFKQTWTENMSKADKPKITKYSSNTGYVSITFYPDLEKFKLDNLDDHIELFHRRVIDIGAVSNDKLKVYFNNEKIKIDNFKKYILLYYPENDIIYDESNERWKVGCLYISDNGNKTISFVNGISTYKGGSHVNHVLDIVIKPLIENYIKKKDIKISPTLVKENLVFFINSIIDNPSFGSQTKDTLETKINNFGSKYIPNENFLKKIAKSGIVEQVIQYAQFKEESKLKKTDGKKQVRLHGIPKLEDANKAGTKDAFKCSLILTEGDSAKTFAMAGLGIIGRDYYGVFPLKGKLLNIREATAKQKMENEEINHLKQIIGLKQNCKYDTDEEYKTLRYGKIIILTDQDVDGSHIKGLIMNLFHTCWSNLMKREGFLTSLATPIVKGFKGNDIKVFYNLTDYEKWKETPKSKGYTIKYYKGLGTSTSKEAKEYFIDIENKLIKYICDDKNTDNVMELAFDKKKADQRKKWLMEYDKNEILKYEERRVLYEDFIHKDLIHFSNDDTLRSIPHIMDGLKPSQRKILYGAFLRGLDKTEVKVAQLAGFVSDRAAYHHGEASLMGAIIGMAQDFVGSNNINVLKPNGGFGTRLQGGKDAASSRYIFTELTKLGIKIFNNLDKVVLTPTYDDGYEVEPEYYAPIIPMILVNGAKGIGTGFSTTIPNFNPKDIINNLLSMLEDGKYKNMIPYYNNFTGKITKVDKDTFNVKGVYNIKCDKMIITELPVGEWTQNYKEFLEKMLESGTLKNYKDKNTDDKVYFELEFEKGYLDNIEDIEKKYHLEKSIKLTNMHLFCVNGNIKKYSTVKQIMEEFYIERLSLYDKRREYYLNLLKYELDILSYKVKFILMVVEKKLIVNNRKKNDIEDDLDKNNFIKDENNSYNYLLGMPIYSLTYEKIEELKKQMNNKETEYETLKNKTGKDIWKEELTDLLKNI
jgi:DNA topoisomerase-2